MVGLGDGDGIWKLRGEGQRRGKGKGGEEEVSAMQRSGSRLGIRASWVTSATIQRRVMERTEKE